MRWENSVGLGHQNVTATKFRPLSCNSNSLNGFIFPRLRGLLKAAGILARGVLLQVLSACALLTYCFVHRFKNIIAHWMSNASGGLIELVALPEEQACVYNTGYTAQRLSLLGCMVYPSKGVSPVPVIYGLFIVACSNVVWSLKEDLSALRPLDASCHPANDIVCSPKPTLPDWQCQLTYAACLRHALGNGVCITSDAATVVRCRTQ